MIIREAIIPGLQEKLAFLRRFPKHPGILKEFGLDNLPAQSIVTVGRNQIQVIIPCKYKSETS